METGNTRTLIVENATDQAVELLKQLIATPSVSRDEEAAADIIEQYLQNAGCTVERKGNNVWARSTRFNNDKPAVLLNAHIDTVKPVAGWVRDPFKPIMEGDQLYGLGSNDCGGGLMALLQVFLLLRAERDDLIFLASCEEEVSGKNGIECVLPELGNIGVAIVGEPTGMQPAIAEKGLMVVDCVAKGRSGHAARNEGLNAIYEAMDDIQWLRNHQFEKQTELLGPVKTTVTIINAGTQHNVIPDECHFTIDVRSNECYSNEEIFSYLQSHMKSEMEARSFRLNSSRIDTEHPLVRRCLELGMTPFGSPTLSDQALMRFPSLKLGPGQSSRSHTADEFICVSEIKDAVEKYLKIITL